MQALVVLERMALVPENQGAGARKVLSALLMQHAADGRNSAAYPWANPLPAFPSQ